MKLAAALTFFFVAATSALGGIRSARIASATKLPSQYIGTAVAFLMTLWCGYLGLWLSGL
jgi:hypothetical protein